MENVNIQQKGICYPYSECYLINNYKPDAVRIGIAIIFIVYCIAGKFGGQNVWRIYSFQAFGGKKVWRMNRSAKGLSMVTTNLVWRIADDSPNSPNFLPPNFPAIRYTYNNP